MAQRTCKKLRISQLILAEFFCTTLQSTNSQKGKNMNTKELALAIELSNSTKDELRDIVTELKNVDPTTFDTLYRLFWESYVREDFETLGDFSEDELDSYVYDYVYNGNYDCNLSYWNNLENIID